MREYMCKFMRKYTHSIIAQLYKIGNISLKKLTNNIWVIQYLEEKNSQTPYIGEKRKKQVQKNDKYIGKLQ